MFKYAVTLVHLGDSVPAYFRDCVHQLRLWSTPEDTIIYCILDTAQRSQPFWGEIAKRYTLTIIFTDELTPTENHTTFLEYYSGDMTFRNGYWRFVKERFFYMEELMLKEDIYQMIAIEYDVLLYHPIPDLFYRLGHYTDRLAFVMDNPRRGHPGCLFIPTASAIRGFNEHIVEYINTPFEDMQLLAVYAEDFPQRCSMLPVITPARNASIPNRTSRVGHTAPTTKFLSAGYDELGFLFDTGNLGQWLGGIDPRNPGSENSIGFVNESSMYSIPEMIFAWDKCQDLWIPTLDSVPVCMIHVHSKNLNVFLSDSPYKPDPLRHNSSKEILPFS